MGRKINIILGICLSLSTWFLLLLTTFLIPSLSFHFHSFEAQCSVEGLALEDLHVPDEQEELADEQGR